jgi:predicted acylesterase/phospholipase RssA
MLKIEGGKMLSPSETVSGRKTRYLILGLIVALVIISLGCDTSVRHNTLPEDLENQAQIPGLPDIRDWADQPSKIFLKSAFESLKQAEATNHGKLEPVVNGLALSGDGDKGAFGAGLLCGWSQAGTRPTFKVVTGISVGALIAPLAFLGPAYDHVLKEVFTNTSDKDIYTDHDALALLLSILNIRPLTSMDSTKPLAKLINKYIDARMLEEIAAEQRKGRRLIVGTTQLETRSAW